MTGLLDSARPTKGVTPPKYQSSVEPFFPATIAVSTPNDPPSPGTNLQQAKAASAPIGVTPAATPLPAASRRASPIEHAPRATNLPESSDHSAADAHATGVAALRLELAAAMLDDLEGLRMATANRVRAATNQGLPAGAYEDQLTALQAMEHRATLDLQRALRQHPLGAWVKRTVGIGEKQGARLIAAIGDPAWNAADERPRRGPAELWKYCGYSPEQKRRKGVKSNWNANAKMRAHLCAAAALQQGVRKGEACDDADGYDLTNRKAITPLGQVYLDARTKAASATHGEPCSRCSPKGKIPAEIGSSLSLSHQHARAIREVAKEILKDLWKAA